MDLLKIGKRKPVEVAIDDDGTTASVGPIGIIKLKELETRFPDFYQVLDPTSLAFKRPEVAVAILAAAGGHCGNPAAEEECASWAATYQMNAVAKVLAMTFPGGIGPFVQALRQIGSLAGGTAAEAAPEQTQAETSPLPSTS